MTDETIPSAPADEPLTDAERIAALEVTVASLSEALEATSGKLTADLEAFGMRLSRALLRLDDVEREKMDAPNASIAWVELDQRLSAAIADADRKAQSALDLHCETHNAARSDAVAAAPPSKASR